VDTQRFHRFVILAICLLGPGWLCIPCESRAQRQSGITHNQPDSVFQVGEELTYNVSFFSYDIGRVRIRVTDVVNDSGHTSYRAAAEIDSYRGVPFLNVHAVYGSKIDAAMYSTWFDARDKEDDRWHEWEYFFEYSKSLLAIREGIWKSDTVIRRDTLSLDTLSQDGLSLFFLARRYLRTAGKFSIPTYIREKKGVTFLNFTGERTNESIEQVRYPIDVIHFNGRAGFVGLYGLTGAFEGWFSNDAARVPILAKMKIFIGDIRIELTEWKRPGWSPPEYARDSER